MPWDCLLVAADVTVNAEVFRRGVLSAAAHLFNSVACYDGHDDWPDRGDCLGWFSDARYGTVEAPDGPLRGIWAHLHPMTGSGIDQLFAVKPAADPWLGLSINCHARRIPLPDTWYLVADDQEDEIDLPRGRALEQRPAQPGDLPVNWLVVGISRVVSVDLVDWPAAGGRFVHRHDPGDPTCTLPLVVGAPVPSLAVSSAASSLPGTGTRASNGSEFEPRST